jgi:hypothetical protein
MFRDQLKKNVFNIVCLAPICKPKHDGLAILMLNFFFQIIPFNRCRCVKAASLPALGAGLLKKSHALLNFSAHRTDING